MEDHQKELGGVEGCECLVCWAKIDQAGSIWSCERCCQSFHLECIERWLKFSRQKTNVCPTCRKEVASVPVPSCFCGKKKFVEKKNGFPAQSCGEICGRPKGTCSHKCQTKCHFGPCPPCSSFDTPLKACFCGSSLLPLACGTQSASCGKFCSKRLDCGHSCGRICHEGDCPPCLRSQYVNCYCNSKTQIFPCQELQPENNPSSGFFSCKQRCHKSLSCGFHLCERPCHLGPCGECMLDPLYFSTCFCGAQPSSRISCADPIRSCGGVCQKILSCGHQCLEKCHSGECPPCKQTVSTKCRCGARKFPRACSERNEEIVCNVRCGGKLLCGKHNCPRECCPERRRIHESLCEKACGHRNSCEIHPCIRLCHRGNCGPCRVIIQEDRSCMCGAEVLRAPFPCGKKGPFCQRKCTRDHECDHEPRHQCHRLKECPPCPVKISTTCAGGHVRGTVRCGSKDHGNLCSRECGKLLPCGSHLCQKTCHFGPCLSSPSFSMPSPSCDQICGRLLALCEHPCPESCHGNLPCPRIVCNSCLNSIPEFSMAILSPSLIRYIESFLKISSTGNHYVLLRDHYLPFTVNPVQLSVVEVVGDYYRFTVQHQKLLDEDLYRVRLVSSSSVSSSKERMSSSLMPFFSSILHLRPLHSDQTVLFLPERDISKIKSLDNLMISYFRYDTLLISCPKYLVGTLLKVHHSLSVYEDVILPKDQRLQRVEKRCGKEMRDKDGLVILGKSVSLIE